MRTAIIIETAEELIRFARPRPLRSQDDKDPYIDPSEVTLVIDGNIPSLQGKNRSFQLGGDISAEDIFDTMAKECNISLHLT